MRGNGCRRYSHIFMVKKMGIERRGMVARCKLMCDRVRH